MAAKIAFIQTGGTIDKDYPRSTGGYAFEIDEPAFERILSRLYPNFTYTVHHHLRKDSQEIDDLDRKKLLDFVSKMDEEKVIITHGTDTMIETARFLDQKTTKTIVVTGAKLPERFSNSDAPINLGTAIGAVQSLGPGVYLAMQGLVIPIRYAGRDLKTGNFLDMR